MAQFFAIYLVPDDEKEGISDEEYILSLLNIFNNTVKNHSDILLLLLLSSEGYHLPLAHLCIPDTWYKIK